MPSRLIGIRFAALALAATLFPAGAFASTPCGQGVDCNAPAFTSELYGFIASNRTLTFASPGPIYDVLGDVIVNPGVTLTVEPGVTLRFAANHDTLQGGVYPTLAELTIRGTLAADATSGDSIRFVGANGGEQEWGHIWVEGFGSVLLRRVRIHGATTAAVLGGSGTQLLENSLVTGCVNGIFAYTTPAFLREVAIVGLGHAVVGPATIGLRAGPGLQTTPADTLSPLPCVVARFQIGVWLTGSATVRSIVARDNSSYGFYSDDSNPRLITYCTAVRNGTGFVTLAQTSVLNSIAALSPFAGITLPGSSYCDFTDSWSNTTNYQLDGGTLGPNVVSFDPFFVDPSTDDFRLAANSIFKHYSNSGGEIGAYGPGTWLAVAVPSDAGPPASLKSSPNPTRGAAVLEFEQAAPGRVTVDILDVLGRRIGRVADDFRAAGPQRVEWGGKDESGGSVPPGLYFWRVSSESGVRTGRLVVSR